MKHWYSGVPNQERYAERCVVVGDLESKLYDGTLRINIKFSPDGHHSAYTVHLRNNSMVVIDGQEGKLYDDVIGGGFRDTANGSDSPQHVFVYIAREGRKFFRVTQLLL